MFDFETAKRKLQDMLKPERYQHSLGVMDTAVQMAERFHCDSGKAKIAGLLHDCAKNFSFEEQRMMCDEFAIPIDEITEASPKVWHQMLGAKVAEREFGVCDTEILNAIACHTTGKAKMGTLDKILYLADFTEPNREQFDGLEELRSLTQHDLDRAMLFALEISIRSVLDRGLLLHPDTVGARNWMLLEKN